MDRRSRRKKKINHRGKMVVSVLIILLLIVAGVFAYWLLGNAKHKQESTPSSTLHQLTRSSSPRQSKTPSDTSKWLQSTADNQLPILMFHYASSQAADLAGGSNWMPDATLEADLALLQKQGYTTLTARQAVQVMTTHTKPSSKMVWLTFDDGSLTLYRDVFPLLKKYHMHATGAIITGFVDKGQSGILTWDQIKEMKASGLVDFVSHTVSHLDLGTLDQAQATEQLEQSKKELDQQLNQKTDIIVYPAGGYNAATLDIAKPLGYKYGLLDPGRNGAVAKEATLSDGLLTLPRFRMASTTGPDALFPYLEDATRYNEAHTK
ncbi:polysaccharide deacetylase family protein [Lactococcus hircilactis]|uniref:polysaccharide deacetylase family protein n=1 Tax=Lactococcus hircilactis TaxID=1494462 RepID=UPI003FA31D98